jgi:hypothetical protein
MKQMKLWMLAAILIICGTTTTLTSCSKDDQVSESPAKKEYFASWNQCEALTALKQYVEDMTNPKSPNFISQEDRIATFDMKWNTAGYHVISMRDDFKTIYGTGVKKVDFTFPAE